MDSSWIELPNDHPDYLDGAVKFIKLAKENLVEGRTRCPCRRCKVEYIDVSTPEGELRKALAGGLNPVAKSVKSFIPPTVMAGASAEARGRSGQILPPPGTGAGASKLIMQQQLHATSTRASIEVPRRSGQLPPPPSTSIKASKPIVQQLTGCTARSKPVVQQLLRPTSVNGGLASQPCLQLQPTAFIAALQPVRTPTSPNGATQPLIRPSTIKFGSNLPCQPPSFVGTSQVNPSTIGLNQPSQPPPVVGTSKVNPSNRSLLLHNQSHSATVKVVRGATRQEVRESPSNGNNDREGLARSSQSQSNDKGKGHVGGKQKKLSTSKSTRSSQSSWKDNIQFDAKEEVLTIDDQGNKEVIKGSILPRDVMNYKQGVRFCVAFNNCNQPIRKGGYIFVRFLGYIARLERFCPIGTISWHKLDKTYKADIIEMFVYPADKCFDKRVLKHVAKYFKQYKHGLKKDYFKPEQKTKEAMYELVPKGHSHDGWMRLVGYWCSKEHETLAEIGTDARALQTLKLMEESQHIWSSLKRHMAKTTEASAKVQERLLSSSPSKTQVEIENEVFDELMYEEENPKRPIGFGFNVHRSDVFGVNNILRKRGYIFPDNNMELKCVKEELASQKAMFLLMLKAVHNGKITDEFLDVIEAALRMAGDQVPQGSSGNNLSNESGHTGPSTSASQVN
ncbi:hypothetical protein Cgig2_021483 [Carnegiea gigantea]|uniref:Transposase-associated domain-containing protein n=1 Tax=Carnegiea gigantea TaxID=171969 RepID=A0A9Q1QGN9_9CARY|nr:hypothetical protein Cgig2_021483 [Carnegiea gigantea]